VVTPLSCSLVGQTDRILLTPGSLAASLYAASTVEEDFFCNYGLNPEYRPRLEAGGLSVTGVDGDGAARIVELREHPFFLATLYCFQTRSRPGHPHPLVAGLIEAAGRLRPAA
jgi:CTP synthase (UTP-ammonia lyase)